MSTWSSAMTRSHGKQYFITFYRSLFQSDKYSAGRFVEFLVCCNKKAIFSVFSAIKKDQVRKIFGGKMARGPWLEGQMVQCSDDLGKCGIPFSQSQFNAAAIFTVCRFAVTNVYLCHAYNWYRGKACQHFLTFKDHTDTALVV